MQSTAVTVWPTTRLADIECMNDLQEQQSNEKPQAKTYVDSYNRRRGNTTKVATACE